MSAVHALGELAVMYPVSGSFYTYSARFIDPSWGFAMGWNYVFQWASVLPLELTICGITIQYWNPEVNTAVWIAIFLVAVIIINIFGAIGYAEEEYWSAVFKLGATVIFMIIAFVLVLGGGPKGGAYDHYWGAKLWYEAPGAFANGFKGFCSVFVTAAFSFSGTELVGLAAAETKNPVKSLPSAIKQVFWRITLFYILGLFFVGLLIHSDDPELLNAGAYDDPHASPFVLVGKYAGLHGFDHFMNLTILISVLSISVSGIYGGSRTLTALAQQGYAPKIFTYIDKSGRPLFSVIVIILCGFIAFVSLSATGPVVFTWLQSISGLAALFTWGSVCLAHIRFRHAWKYHGHSLDEIPFQAAGGIWGSYLGLFLNVIVLIAQVCFLDLYPVTSEQDLLTLHTSSILPSLPPSASLVPAPLKTSSDRTSPLLSFSSSGPSDTCGSAKVTSPSPRSMSIPVAVSLIGRRSTPTVPRLLHGQSGDALPTFSSKWRRGGLIPTYICGSCKYLYTCTWLRARFC